LRWGLWWRWSAPRAQREPLSLTLTFTLTLTLPLALPKPKPRQVCPAAQRFAALVARKLAASGGAALFVDYGKDGPPASSLRGIVDHAFVDPLLRCAGGGGGSCSRRGGATPVGGEG